MNEGNKACELITKSNKKTGSNSGAIAIWWKRRRTTGVVSSLILGISRYRVADSWEFHGNAVLLGILFIKLRFDTEPTASQWQHRFSGFGDRRKCGDGRIHCPVFPFNRLTSFFHFYLEEKPENGVDCTVFRLFVMSAFIRSFLPKIFQRYVHAPVHPK